MAVFKKKLQELLSGWGLASRPHRGNLRPLAHNLHNQQLLKRLYKVFEQTNATKSHYYRETLFNYNTVHFH